MKYSPSGVKLDEQGDGKEKNEHRESKGALEMVLGGLAHWHITLLLHACV